VTVLTGVAPFDRYPPAMLAPLAVHADRLEMRDGTVVAQEGQRAREVAVVVAGVLLAHRGGRPIGLFGPGTWVGAAELLDDRPHALTLVAGEGLEVLVVTVPAYRWALQTLPGLAERRVLDLRTTQAALAGSGLAAGSAPTATGPAESGERSANAPVRTVPMPVGLPPATRRDNHANQRNRVTQDGRRAGGTATR
jgi:hypothetical protein